MKTVRLIVVAILFIVTTTLFAQKVEGQITSLPFGSMSKVESFAVSNVNSMVIFTDYFNLTNNSWEPFINSGWYGKSPLTNKYQMDQIIIAPELSNILGKLLIETDTNICKDKGLRIYVVCDMIAGGEISRRIFSNPFVVYITPTKTNGVYGIPDLSWFRTTMSSDIPFYIPGLSWARMEIGYRANTNQAFEVYDNRIDPSTDVLHSDGFMYLPVDVISNASTTNGAYWMKLSILHGNSFQSFNGDGKLLTETPMRTWISSSNNSVTVTVTGGDSGRSYYLQQSTNLMSWTNCSTVNSVSAFTHLQPYKRSFVYQKTNTQAFFRTVTTNVIPY